MNAVTWINWMQLLWRTFCFLHHQITLRFRIQCAMQGWKYLVQFQSWRKEERAENFHNFFALSLSLRYWCLKLLLWISYRSTIKFINKGALWHWKNKEKIKKRNCWVRSKTGVVCTSVRLSNIMGPFPKTIHGAKNADIFPSIEQIQ